jgi:hypothetical protein
MDNFVLLRQRNLFKLGLVRSPKVFSALSLFGVFQRRGSAAVDFISGTDAAAG